MKLRNPRLIRAAARLGTVALLGWMRTLPFRYVRLGPDFDPRRPGFRGRYVYAFWHEYILLPAALYGRADIAILSSRHADGQLMAGIAGRLGFSVVHGSTTRGGVEAVRGLLRADCNLALTPDGPRGPRRRVKPGVVYLASRLGLAVVPFGVGFDRPWRARSWDRFALPRPGGRAVIVTADPIDVPAAADRATLEGCRLRVERELQRVSELAEGWAERGAPAAGPAPPIRRRCGA
jgi:lysophospholipid acyltransferase (LPLAT)-like uncharacterized protein